MNFSLSLQQTTTSLKLLPHFIPAMAKKVTKKDFTPVSSPLPSKDESIKLSQQSPHSSLQQGTNKPFQNYFDVMFIGKTGAGKSTTADKVLIANPLGLPYEGTPHMEPERDEENGHIKHSDMCMWHLSAKPNEIECVTQRLKNLVFCRSLAEPHEEVNSFHTEHNDNSSTQHCELLSNDSNNVRVLDVPGFYGSEASSSGDTGNVRERALAGTDNDLSIMRKILHIKMAKKFKFNRIVYFLPEKGVLERHSNVLQTEIAIMENYFGKSIFESMVVVATYPASAYKFFDKTRNLFPVEDHQKTKHFFDLAMENVFRSNDIPQPPIIFISLFDTCEEILSKIKESQVSREGVELEFNPSTCARCNIKIGTLREDRKIEHKDGLLATCSYDNDWKAAIPYEESTCHPMMIPKYSKLVKIVGEIAHLITFKLFLGKWPSFTSLDEVCISCGQCPKTRGCTKVRTDFTKGSGTIHVDHTSTVDESYVIKIDDTCEEMQDEETSATIGTKYFSGSDASGVKGYTPAATFVAGVRGSGDGGEAESMEEGEAIN